MKKILLSTVMTALSLAGFAQSTNIEPEYNGQVAIVNSDSTTILLQKEPVKMKTKSTNFGLIPIPGSGLLDKAKTKMVLKGTEAPVSVKAGRVTLILKASTNEEDPARMFSMIKLEKSKKERSYVAGEFGISGSSYSLGQSNVPFLTKKYGKNCYLIVIENAEPGEYAVCTELTALSTFSVKE